MGNLLRGGFQGAVMPVNPKHEAVAGVLAYPDVESLPKAPDLAVICTPPPVVPDMVAKIGDRGTRAVVVLTAGLSRICTSKGVDLQKAMLEAARPNCLRVFGPNCLGLLVPAIGLNASFAHVAATPGHVAFVSQSGRFARPSSTGRARAASASRTSSGSAIARTWTRGTSWTTRGRAVDPSDPAVPGIG